MKRLDKEFSASVKDLTYLFESYRDVLVDRNPVEPTPTSPQGPGTSISNNIALPNHVGTAGVNSASSSSRSPNNHLAIRNFNQIQTLPTAPNGINTAPPIAASPANSSSLGNMRQLAQSVSGPFPPQAQIRIGPPIAGTSRSTNQIGSTSRSVPQALGTLGTNPFSHYLPRQLAPVQAQAQAVASTSKSVVNPQPNTNPNSTSNPTNHQGVGGLVSPVSPTNGNANTNAWTSLNDSRMDIDRTYTIRPDDVSALSSLILNSGSGNVRSPTFCLICKQLKIE